ncbi:hypothetical protein K402DRAFT_422025 [Aulographum hederae CBS 113979]|uniref:Uncharacterized protein n=1 Tax=Aulographum hederae CBS 113979 TaxID=1176131 RepID=A0A6G1GWR3_9PEZI|nr:hypothetical protein K402DRAFT_422025 [Aulographum hederae CBS 113979]
MGLMLGGADLGRMKIGNTKLWKEQAETNTQDEDQKKACGTTGTETFRQNEHTRSASWNGKSQRGLGNGSWRDESQYPQDGARNHEDVPQQLSEFRQALITGNFKSVAALYPKLASTSLLETRDVFFIAQCLHTTYRTNTRRKPEWLPALIDFGNKLSSDIRLQIVPGGPDASLHLLSFFKEADQYDSGAKYWSWLENQDESQVTSVVYGAGIEFWARHSKTLPELEGMYADGLARFPGTFAEYHLSPQAIIPDRRRQTEIPGLAMTLLQGIMTARVFHGDWRNAYLAMDTALRLFPGKAPDRFFALIVHERPVLEAYQAFMMACRSGVVVQPVVLTVLLDKLLEKRGVPQNIKLMSVNAALMAALAYIGAEGRLNGQHLSSIISGFKILIQLKQSSASDENAPISSDHNVTLCAMARRLMLMGLQSGQIPLTVSVFNSLLSLATDAEQSGLIKLTEQDMSNVGVVPNAVFYRIMVAASAIEKDPVFLKQAWTNLLENAERTGKSLERNDFLALASAWNEADSDSAFVQDLMGNLDSHALAEISKHGGIRLGKLEARKRRRAAGESLPPVDLTETKEIVGLIERVLKSDAPWDFIKNPIPTAFGAPFTRTSPNQDTLRTLYDEFTTDPKQPQPEDPRPPELSPTGIPLHDLRFLNWIDINHLMAQAKEHERRKVDAVERAIANKEPVRMRPFTLAESIPVDPIEDEAEATDEERAAKRDALKQEIIELRGYKPPASL